MRLGGGLMSRNARAARSLRQARLGHGAVWNYIYENSNSLPSYCVLASFHLVITSNGDKKKLLQIPETRKTAHSPREKIVSAPDGRGCFEAANKKIFFKNFLIFVRFEQR
jgi:hypothetical protein